MAGPTDVLDRPARKVLTRLGACPEGTEWAKDKTLRQMWSESDRPEWMLWLAVRCGVGRAKVWEATCRAVQILSHDFTPIWVWNAVGACFESKFADALAGLAVSGYLSSEMGRAAWQAKDQPLPPACGHACNVIRGIIPAEMLRSAEI